MIRIVGPALASYLVGSLPIARLAAPAREAGVPAPWIRAALIATDALRGVLVMGIVGASGNPYVQALAATAVVAGQQWPLWASERDELGLAVAAGALTVVTPVAVPVWAVLWAIGYVTSGYLTAGSALATLLFPLAIGFLAGWPFALVSLPVCVMVFERLRAPLRRMLGGEESRHYWRKVL